MRATTQAASLLMAENKFPETLIEAVRYFSDADGFVDDDA